MDALFLAGMGLVSLFALVLIIRMIRNRLNGRDELDDLFSFLRSKKGRGK